MVKRWHMVHGRLTIVKGFLLMGYIKIQFKCVCVYIYIHIQLCIVYILVCTYIYIYMYIWCMWMATWIPLEFCSPSHRPVPAVSSVSGPSWCRGRTTHLSTSRWTPNHIWSQFRRVSFWPVGFFGPGSCRMGSVENVVHMCPWSIKIWGDGHPTHSRNPWHMGYTWVYK